MSIKVAILLGSWACTAIALISPRVGPIAVLILLINSIYWSAHFA